MDSQYTLKFISYFLLVFKTLVLYTKIESNMHLKFPITQFLTLNKYSIEITKPNPIEFVFNLIQ